MRYLKKVSLLFISCFVGWSANAQQSERHLAEMAWVTPASEPSPDPVVRPPRTSSTATSLTSASFVLHHQGDAVLLHLKDKRNHVTLQVINAAGQVMQTTTQTNLTSGFHELTLRVPPSTLCALRLIVNQEVTVFSAIRYR
ncbi:MAG: hypothetical protein WA958_09085 [Tunicatimonas sp.]